MPVTSCGLSAAFPFLKSFGFSPLLPIFIKWKTCHQLATRSSSVLSPPKRQFNVA